MEKVVEKSIQRIREMNTTQKKYNKYAEKHNLLSSWTIMIITGKRYQEIKNDVE